MIKALEQGTILYHGSYTAVVKPDIVKCAKNKDFGQGFYLTTDKAQADTFAKISLQKAYQNFLPSKILTSKHLKRLILNG